MEHLAKYLDKKRLARLDRSWLIGWYKVKEARGNPKLAAQMADEYLKRRTN